MHNRSDSSGRWRWFIPILPLVTLTSCLVVVSTNPTTISGATIVFVATDDHGAFVSSLQVTVVDLAGDWRVEGLTTRDGSFQCGVRAGVTRIRVEVAPPAGYVLVLSDTWPRHLDVSTGGSVRVDIKLKAR